MPIYYTYKTADIKEKTMVTDYLTLRTILIFLAAVSVPLLLRFLIRLLKRNSREKELRQKAQDRQREETLDLVLLNPQQGQAAAGSVPYEVDYAGNDKGMDVSGRRTSDQIMVQLTEHNELSRRKHMMSLEKNIRIGSDGEGNSIVVGGVGSCQCELFRYRSDAYIRDVGAQRMTILQRKKQKVYVERNGIQLRTGDRVILGNVFFDITIIR